MRSLGWSKCPQCGARLHENKDTSTGSDIREYRCSQCDWSKTKNHGIAMWKALADADKWEKSNRKLVLFEFGDQIYRKLGIPKMLLPVPLDRLPQIMASGDLSLDLLHMALLAYAHQNPQEEVCLAPTICMVSYHLGKREAFEQKKLFEQKNLTGGIKYLTEALHHLSKWVEPPPELVTEIHWHLGRALILAGRKSEGISLLEEVVRLTREDGLVRDVWLALAYLAYSRGDLERGDRYVRDYIAHAHRFFPDRVVEFLKYGWNSRFCRASAPMQSRLFCVCANLVACQN